MGGKEVAVLAKNYFKDILTAVFDYKNKKQWEIAFLCSLRVSRVRKENQCKGDSEVLRW
ncbi:hypothetical protein Emtol_1878 [Emticicia oligotrophica DSM 17448]|uniref:Uncharacterized protein n=1 Tax=Emticicia oligotrophica (strain DSM 17448 / CIP 109782 / MTCC 6937 / GPTSA100-15) TaxID=929562 RepID=A0ABN4AL14_EMTOG|nr:hypothetical protein [Emticicia oligotrophica]AFK03018.1 hypothetical protein Emtol_1878 [Emticicia oligotrophica DSM 17448]